VTQMLPVEQTQLIDRFMGAFNASQKHLARALQISPEEQVFRLVDEYGRRNPMWAQGDGQWL
jgi:hypothetical protein